MVHNLAYDYIGRSIEAVDYQPKHYQTWFGSPQQGKTAVKHNYQLMYKFMGTHTIIYVMSGTKCGPDDFAYTHKGSHAIYYCKLFWLSTLTYPPYNSKVCTSIHELSHTIAHTNDLAYGVKQCKSLSNHHPRLAIMNADDYCYFSETLKPANCGL